MKHPTKQDIIETSALIVIIAGIAALVLYCLLFPNQGIEEGNYWKCFDNEQLDMSKEVFAGTLLTMKFFNLSREYTYHLVYFTARDTINVASFEDVTEYVLVIEAEQQTYHLLRWTKEDLKMVIVIWINPMAVQNTYLFIHEEDKSWLMLVGCAILVHMF